MWSHAVFSKRKNEPLRRLISLNNLTMTTKYHICINPSAILSLILIITIFLSNTIIICASTTGKHSRPADKFVSDSHNIIQGHRPATSIQHVKSLHLHHQKATSGGGNEFDRLNRAKKRRPITRVGLHDAVLHATRKSRDIVVMGATSI